MGWLLLFQQPWLWLPQLIWPMPSRIIATLHYHRKLPHSSLHQRLNLHRRHKLQRLHRLRRQSLRQGLMIRQRLNLLLPGMRLRQVLHHRRLPLLPVVRLSGHQDLLPAQQKPGNDHQDLLHGAVLAVVRHVEDMIAGVAVVIETGTAAGICRGAVETLPGAAEAAVGVCRGAAAGTEIHGGVAEAAVGICRGVVETAHGVAAGAAACHGGAGAIGAAGAAECLLPDETADPASGSTVATPRICSRICGMMV